MISSRLVRALAWPVTTLIIVFVLRSELQHFAKNVAERIQTANTVTIGRRGIELKGLIYAVSADVQMRKVEFRRYITTVSEKGELDAIADALKLAKSANIRSLRSSILLEVARLVKTGVEMDALSVRLKSITKRDFNMPSLQSLPVRPELSAQELELVIQQQEELLGPLVSIGNDSAATLLTFDMDQDPPTNPPVLRAGSLDIRGAAAVLRGICFINGRLQEVTAYRPYS